MTDQELLEYSADVLHYTVSMVHETAKRLVIPRDTDTDIVVKNALIESFATHVRRLASFLYEEKPKFDTDVTAECYVRDVRAWREARGAQPEEMKDAAWRASKEVAHLTATWHPPGAPEKLWKPQVIVRAFWKPLKLFADHAPPERLHSRARSLIGSLPSPPASTSP